MFFRDIPGKESEKTSLITAVTSGKLPHAQLLLGKSGSGNLAMALALSSYILCKDRAASDSCGVCSACVKSHKYSHPDFHFTFPVVKHPSHSSRDKTTSNVWLKEWRSIINEQPYLDINIWQQAMNAGNSQPNINKEECLEIVHKLGMKTFESDHKILVLWLPEYLQKEGNRLLKLIEEPAPDTVILMVATRQEDILNTIISRVQITNIPPFTPDEIATYISEREEAAYDIARQLGVMSDGNLGQALSMVGGDFTDYSESLFTWLRISYKMDPVDLRKWIDNVATWGREGQKNFLSYCLHFFREYVYWYITGSTEIKLSEKEIATAQKMKATVDLEKVEKLVAVMDSCQKAIGRNANPKITLMADSLEIGYIMRSMDKSKVLFES